MAIKTIKYTVDSSGISPKVRQDGGIQGDHKITDLEFTIDSGLYEKLSGKVSSLENGKIYYHFNMYNGEGVSEQTLPQELAANIVVFPLEEWITRYGGIIKVVLVLTLGDGTETLQELYVFPAVLSLKSRPTGSEPDRKNYQSMALMSVEAVKAAAQAAEDSRSASASAEIAKNYAEAFNESEVIFQSNLDGEGQPIPFELVIDGEFSEESDNPVKNKTITAKMKEFIKRDELDVFKKEMLSDVDGELSSESEKPIQNKAVAKAVDDINNCFGVDYIVEQGTSLSETGAVTWRYRIWKSGIAECWGRKSINITSSEFNGALWGGWSHSGLGTRITYPFVFKAPPCETALARSENHAFFSYASSAGCNSTTQSAAYSIARPTTISADIVCYLDIYVIGEIASQ